MSGDVLSNEKSKGNTFTYKMVIQLNVFAMSIKHRIDSHVQRTEIITEEDWRRSM
jgi:transposase